MLPQEIRAAFLTGCGHVRWPLTFTVLSAVMVFGIVFPLDGLSPYKGNEMDDTGQMVWNLWWMTESVLSGQNPLLTDLIYYPLGANLATHTLSLGFVPVALLVKLVTLGSPMYPVYALNLIVWMCYALIAYFTFRTLRALGYGPWVSFIPAVAYGFCDFFYLHWLHLNHLSGFMLPLIAFLVVRLWKQPSAWGAVGLGIAVAWSVYLTEFALFIVMAMLLFAIGALLHRLWRRRLIEKLRLIGVGGIVSSVVAFLLLAAPFAYYFVISNVEPPPESWSSRLSTNLVGLFVPSVHSTWLYGGYLDRFSTRVTIGQGGFEVFLGYPLILFSVLGMARTRRYIAWLAIGVAVFFLVLSLGPTLKLFEEDTGIRMPYTWLMKIPPLDQNRSPVRLAVIGQFFLVFAMATGLREATAFAARRGGRIAAGIFVGLIALWTGLEAYSPVARPHNTYQPPAELAGLVPGPTVHISFPIRACNQVLHQVFHGQPMVNGCLARITKEQYAQLLRLYGAFRRDPRLFGKLLEEMGVRNIVVDSPLRREELEALRRLPFNVVVLRNPE